MHTRCTYEYIFVITVQSSVNLEILLSLLSYLCMFHARVYFDTEMIKRRMCDVSVFFSSMPKERYDLPRLYLHESVSITLGPCLHSIWTIYCVGEVWIGADCKSACVLQHSPHIQTLTVMICFGCRECIICMQPCQAIRISKCMFTYVTLQLACLWTSSSCLHSNVEGVTVGVRASVLLHLVTHPILHRTLHQCPASCAQSAAPYQRALHVCSKCWVSFG